MRDRSEKLAEYIKVWDLREGWVDGGYDRSRERTLREIAQELGKNLYTTRNHYCSAFEMIFGHDYSPELWCRVMGQLKLAELTESVDARVSHKRPLKSPGRAAAPESRVASTRAASGAPGLASGAVPSAGDAELRELFSDILTLVRKGAEDEQIRKELDLTENALPVIEYLRRRHADGLTAQE